MIFIFILSCNSAFCDSINMHNNLFFNFESDTCIGTFWLFFNLEGSIGQKRVPSKIFFSSNFFWAHSIITLILSNFKSLSIRHLGTFWTKCVFFWLVPYITKFNTNFYSTKVMATKVWSKATVNKWNQMTYQFFGSDAFSLNDGALMKIS